MYEDIPSDVGRLVNHSLFNFPSMHQNQDAQFTPMPETVATKTPNNRKFENATVLGGKFQQIGGQTRSKEDEKRKGRRTGPLTAEKKKKAGKVRNTGACWRCWYYKTPVSKKEGTHPYLSAERICSVLWKGLATHACITPTLVFASGLTFITSQNYFFIVSLPIFHYSK
jgi:hypothetical protein